MDLSAWTRSRGVSFVEILIVIGLLVVLLSFAAPSISGASVKAELKAATENMDFSIHAARSTARMNETEIVIHLHRDPEDKNHSISFSLADESADSSLGDLLQPYVLPQSIRLVSDEDSIRFDSRGIAEQPVEVTLIAAENDDFYESRTIR